MLHRNFLLGLMSLRLWPLTVLMFYLITGYGILFSTFAKFLNSEPKAQNIYQLFFRSFIIYWFIRFYIPQHHSSERLATFVSTNKSIAFWQRGMESIIRYFSYARQLEFRGAQMEDTYLSYTGNIIFQSIQGHFIRLKCFYRHEYPKWFR